MAYREAPRAAFEYEMFVVPDVLRMERHDSLQRLYLDHGWRIISVTYDSAQKEHHYHLQREKH